MMAVAKGRKMVIGLIVIVLLIDIVTIVSISSIYALSGKMNLASFKLLQGIFRFILTGLMMFFLYKGHRWAKWLSVVLFILAGIGALLSLMKTFNFILLALGLVYIFFGVMLVTSSCVDDFFLYQKDENIPNYRGYR